MNLLRLMAGIPVDAALEQIDAHPELWGENAERLAEGSPHAGCQDIWLRFRAREELKTPEDFDVPHFAVFYPAWGLLPALRPLVFGLMGLVEATYLGGVMLTRIPPGGQVKPHIDRGWHPATMNLKAYVILRANEHCINRCGDETVTMRPGEAWAFENSVTHSVVNNGDAERIAMIVTMMVET